MQLSSRYQFGGIFAVLVEGVVDYEQRPTTRRTIVPIENDTVSVCADRRANAFAAEEAVLDGEVDSSIGIGRRSGILRYDMAEALTIAKRKNIDTGSVILKKVASVKL